MSQHSLQHKIQKFRRKLFINLLLKGVFLSLGVVGSYFLLVSLAEYFSYFNSNIRLGILASLFIAFIGTAYIWVIKPIITYNKIMTDEETAREIGQRMPAVQDKLLNALILKNSYSSDLVWANLEQKETNFQSFDFSNTISYSENRKQFLIFLIPTLVILGLLVLNNSLITEPGARIIDYQTFYAKPAPFKYELLNNNLDVYKNESINLRFKVTGEVVPSEVFINKNGVKHAMVEQESGEFHYTINNVTSPFSFQLESADVISQEYTLNLLERPLLKSTLVQLQYPSYLKKKPKTIQNSSTYIVPEGTKLNFEFITESASSAKLLSDSLNEDIPSITENQFKYDLTAYKPTNFNLKLKNQHGQNKNELSYFVNVIKDKYPTIRTNIIEDTSFFQNVFISGSVMDDYGLTSLRLFYKVFEDNQEIKSGTEKISLSGAREQNFLYQWDISSLLSGNQTIKYYLKVWDNDQIHNYKSSKTATYEVKLPDQKEAAEKIAKTEKQVDNAFDSKADELEKLMKQMTDVENKLRSKKNLNWEDKKDIQEILNQHKKLQKAIDDLTKQIEQLKEQQKKFGNKNEELLEKHEKLQKLMEEVLDEETKKLLEELQKLLEKKNSKPENITEKLEKLQKNDVNMEKELERAMELYKKLKFEQKIENSIQKLDKLQKEQEKAANQEQKSEEKQEKLNEEFKDLQKELEEIDKLNKETKSGLNDELKEQQELGKQVEQQQKEGSENIKKGNSKKAGEKQKNASEGMEKMKQNMQDMLTQMQQEQREEDYDNLRRILDNLVKISYDQEDLTKIFKKLNQVNPQFVEQSAKQLKIKNDSKILEDSLLELASRIFEIESIVIKELFAMNEHLDKSLEAIRDRKVSKITSNQQFAMTSMNNLALLLSDVMNQMQQSMAEKKSGNQNCSKPGGKKPSPSKGMGKMQEAISDQIRQLKKSGEQQGQNAQNSEKLAKLAAEQEKIRKALREMEKMMDKKKGGGSELGKLDQLMEENEVDLLNKRITQETINRQKEIMTRLLEAEKAMREREWDEKRESRTAEQQDNRIPPNIEKYLEQRKKEIEQLKSISPNYSPYYKNEIGEYFKIN